MVEDVSFAERVDGASGVGARRFGRTRRTHSVPLPVSPLQLLALMARFGPLWEMLGEFKEPAGRPGRPLATSPICVALIELLTHDERSQRSAVEFLRDPVVWEYLRAEVAYAWPDHPDRRLPDVPITREQCRYYKQTRIEFADVVARIREMHRDIAIAVAHSINICNPNDGSVTHPSTTQVCAGDATHLRPMNDVTRDDLIDKTTGEIRRLPYVPDAYELYGTTDKPGYKMVSCLARNAAGNERVILDLDLQPKGTGDATVFTDMVINLHRSMPGLRVPVYDMAMHPGDFDRLLDDGLIPVTKAQLTTTGKRAQLNIGEHDFRAKGRATQTVIVTAIDGAPCITVPTADGPQEVELERRQTKIVRRSRGKHTIGGFWFIPDRPEVPKNLRLLETWIHHNSTVDETARKKPRTRALRVIPPNDRDFRALFGVREDTESMHNHLKQSLINGRVRGLGEHRLRFNLHAYQLRTNIIALLAHHAGNAAELEHWFGRSRPPNEPGLAA